MCACVHVLFSFLTKPHPNSPPPFIFLLPYVLCCASCLAIRPLVCLAATTRTPATAKQGRPKIFRKWKREGGICIIGYELLANMLSKKRIGPRLRYKLRQYLQPDILIMDEGHVATNMESSRFKVLHSIPTARKLILTGTPLQNNLVE